MLEKNSNPEEFNFWEETKLDKDRVFRGLDTVLKIRNKKMDYKESIDNLANLLLDFNLREVAYMLLYLDYLTDTFSKKLLTVANILNEDNSFVIESVLSFTDMFSDYRDKRREIDNE